MPLCLIASLHGYMQAGGYKCKSMCLIIFVMFPKTKQMNLIYTWLLNIGRLENI